MNQPIDLDNPNFTSFAAGELDGAELEAFHAMLAQPSARKELEETESLIRLLTDGLKAEWRNQVAPYEEQSLTGYALRELDDDEMDAVESMVDHSPGVADELAGIEAMMGLLSESLEGEWRSREWVDLDVPEFTDYALGELSGGQASDFEAMLKYSTTAVRELGATKDMISLLSEGLEKEWKSELSSADHEFSLVEATGEENIVSVNFAQASSGSVRSRKNRSHALISLAAVLAGALVVIGMLQQPAKSGQNSVAAVGFSSDDHVWDDFKGNSTQVDEVPLEPVINLRLLEEVNQPIQDFDLPEDEMAGMDFCFPMPDCATSPDVQFVRVDSYLPGKGDLAYAVKEGLFGMNGSRLALFNHCPEIMTFPGGSGFDLNSACRCEASDLTSKEGVLEEVLRLRKELESIASDLGRDNALRLRLDQVIGQFRELGVH